MTTQEERVAAALKELDPEPDDIERCREDIESALDVIEMDTRHIELDLEPQRKRGREGVKLYKQYLDKLIEAHRRLPLPSHIEIMTLDFDKRARKLSGFLEKVAKLPKRLPAPSSHKQRACVSAAFGLLNAYGHTPVRSSKGNWDRLAAILYGAELDRHGRPTVSLQKQLVRAGTGKKRGPNKKKRSGR